MLHILFSSAEKKLLVAWRQNIDFICSYLSKLHTTKLRF